MVYKKNLPKHQIQLPIQFPSTQGMPIEYTHFAKLPIENIHTLMKFTKEKFSLGPLHLPAVAALR